jgi:hypothetical protein
MKTLVAAMMAAVTLAAEPKAAETSDSVESVSAWVRGNTDKVVQMTTLSQELINIPASATGPGLKTKL